MQRASAKSSLFFVPGSIINMISGNLSIEFGFKGSEHLHRHGLYHRHAFDWGSCADHRIR